MYLFFDHDQRELAQLWKRARKDGCMPPWQQAKVEPLLHVDDIFCAIAICLGPCGGTDKRGVAVKENHFVEGEGGV